MLLSVIIILMMLSVANAQSPAQSVPSFSFSTMDGVAFSNAQLPKNKMLFFFCFDPDCDHCQRAAVNLKEHYKEYKRTHFYIISASSKQRITQFIERYAPAFKNNNEVTILQDPKNEFVTRFQPFRYPAMFLFASNGKLADYEDNEESMFRFRTTLKKLNSKVSK